MPAGAKSSEPRTVTATTTGAPAPASAGTTSTLAVDALTVSLGMIRPPWLKAPAEGSLRRGRRIGASAHRLEGGIRAGHVTMHRCLADAVLLAAAGRFAAGIEPRDHVA